jgi:hypothetical protein
MSNSIFLAKFLSIYLIIVGIGILYNLKNCQKLALEYGNSAALIYFGGIMALFFGILIILFHNVWTSDWRIIITLFGWLGLLKGSWLIIFPGTVKNFVERYQKSTTPIMVQSLIIITIGLFLAIKGYL